MILLIDIGNTRIKWATLTEAGLGAQRAEPHAGWSEQQLIDTVLAPLSGVERVLVANVGGPQLGDLTRNAVAKLWRIEAQFVVSTTAACGVRNAYPVPANLGVDRWLGVIAAHARGPQLACIVGVGTAMTIDGVDAAGQHLGGVIVPGPQLMVSSLLHGTSDIASRAQQGMATDALFADNTLGAIRQGSVHALAALVERAVDSMQRQAGTPPLLLLTGGAASAIAGLIRAPHESIPDLVLQGLAHYATSVR